LNAESSPSIVYLYGLESSDVMSYDKAAYERALAMCTTVPICVYKSNRRYTWLAIAGFFFTKSPKFA